MKSKLHGRFAEICRAANEEHAKELPIMNGIKEDIKSVVVLAPGGAAHQEALLNLSLRLRLLQVGTVPPFLRRMNDLAWKRALLLRGLNAAAFTLGTRNGAGSTSRRRSGSYCRCWRS